MNQTTIHDFVGEPTKKPKFTEPFIIKKKCTCGFPQETADEIGHFKACPCYGDKTWWQKKSN
jgi:hypothetical protein